MATKNNCLWLWESKDKYKASLPWPSYPKYDCLWLLESEEKFRVSFPCLQIDTVCLWGTDYKQRMLCQHECNIVGGVMGIHYVDSIRPI